MNIKRTLIISLIVVTSYSLISSCYGVNMRSDQYRIQFGTIGIGGNKMDDLDNNTYTLTTSLGQAAAREFASNGYTIKAGFQYVYSRIPFTFSLSSTKVDFGTLLPSSPKTGQITLKVSFGGAGQYIVTALSDGPFKQIAGSNIIPATACDGGLDTCTVTVAKPWTSSSIYGLGYSMTGQDITTDFVDTTYYRPFANALVPENPAVIMQSINVTANLTPTPNPSYSPAPSLAGVQRDTTHQSIMTMKTNISSVQPAGSYTTIIRFLATPSF